MMIVVGSDDGCNSAEVTIYEEVLAELGSGNVVLVLLSVNLGTGVVEAAEAKEALTLGYGLELAVCGKLEAEMSDPVSGEAVRELLDALAVITIKDDVVPVWIVGGNEGVEITLSPASCPLDLDVLAFVAAFEMVEGG